MTRQLPSTPSAGLGTAFRRNLFLTARLKLTALYVLIVAIIVCGFSLFLYQSTLKNFSDASEEDFAGSLSRRHFVEAASVSLQHTLIFSDLTIIALAAALSYLLAGRTLKPVEESHEAQQTFAAQASHELRTPLAIMRNDIEVLLRNRHDLPSEAREIFASNLEEIQKMTVITEDLLALARSEQAQEKKVVPFEIGPMIATVLNKMQPLAAQAHVRLAAESIDKLFIAGDEDSLARAVINVVKNSIEHTPANGVITIKVAQESTFAHIVVEDSGSGIHPEDLPHVFTRFYKGEKRSSEGTGLGLAIVKEIVEQNGGSVAIESVLGEGTTVNIHLPLA
jgi:signal transduction histidine kinase